MEADEVKARCSLWWTNSPPSVNGKVGLIGHYAAADDDASAELFEYVCLKLAQQGCTLAIGPMDQNTWRDYRLIVDEGDRPRFFLEPDSVPQWCEQFRRDGFREIASYCSALVEDLKFCCPRLVRVRARMNALGINIRPLDRDQLDRELKQIFAVVQRAFQENPFYVPVSESDFLEMYGPLRNTIPTDWILLAEHEEKVVGFVFAVPDLLQAQRGSPIDTIVVKTCAVLPERAYGGVGQVLLESVHHGAAAGGLCYAIHALVRDSARTNRIVDRYGVPFRRYALFGKEIG
jgi:GNAT superfamily N-acetyltransferase